MELPIDDVATCFRVNGFMSLEDILASVDKDYTALVALSASAIVIGATTRNSIVTWSTTCPYVRSMA